MLIAFRDRRGQSLIEVLIGLVIGAIMVGAVAAIIAPVLRIDTQTSRAQIAAALGKELLDNVQVWSEANWHNIDRLLMGATSTYSFSTTSPAFASSTGAQSVIVGSSTYSRYFYLNNVYRDTVGQISSVGTLLDPSTRLVTVVYAWQPASSTGALSKYIVRSKNNFFLQTNWAGGSGVAGPVTSTANRFASSSNVNVTTSTGSIILQGF